MKKVISIIFLSLLVLKLGAYFAFLSIEQEIIREEMTEKVASTLSNSELVQLKFSKENLEKIEWERAEKEFWFQGKMYDIVRSETKNGEQIFYCLSDEKETEIEAQIEKLGDDFTNNSPSRSTNFQLLNLLFQQFILPQKFNFSTIFLQDFSVENFQKIKIFYLPISLDILIPPPKF